MSFISCRNISKIPCIYKITNTVNEKFYIGSCINFNRRKAFHKFTLRKGKHCNKYLQKSWNKYTEDSFKFEIIEHCTKENLIKREQYYIDTLNPHYNSRIIADSNINNKRVFTEKEKEAARERNKKFRKLSKEQVRGIQALRRNGTTIREISIIYKLEKSAISRILSGKWYKEFYEPIIVKGREKMDGYKLKKEVEETIITMLKENRTYKEIFDAVGVCSTTVWKIKKKLQNV